MAVALKVKKDTHQINQRPQWWDIGVSKADRSFENVGSASVLEKLFDFMDVEIRIPIFKGDVQGHIFGKGGGDSPKDDGLETFGVDFDETLAVAAKRNFLKDLCHNGLTGFEVHRGVDVVGFFYFRKPVFPGEDFIRIMIVLILNEGSAPVVFGDRQFNSGVMGTKSEIKKGKALALPGAGRIDL